MGQVGGSQLEGPSHEPKGGLMGWSGIQKPPLLTHPKTRNKKTEYGILKTAAITIRKTFSYYHGELLNIIHVHVIKT